MALNFLVSALVTLLVVVDPVGLVPTFIGITDGLSDSLRRGVGLRAALIAGAILIGAALIGNWLLSVLAISLSAFRIAGGLLLFSVATEMVLGVRMRREGEVAEQAMEEHARNIAAFPLAIPLMARPGPITALVLLAGRTEGSSLLLALLIAVAALVPAACYLAFLSASRLGGILGVAAHNVLSRLLGVLLAALAVQYVVDGIRAVLKG